MRTRGMCWFAVALIWAGTPALARQAAPTEAQQGGDARAQEIAKAIDVLKSDAQSKSQVMETLAYLTDVIGPRLTGSPQMKRANEWTRDKMTEWGLENARLEAWGPFGRGWSLKRFSAQVTEPQCIPLIALPKAWSPGLAEPAVGPVVHFDARTEADFEKFKGKLKGAIVLLGAKREVKAWFTPPGERYTDTQLLNMANAPDPQPRVPRGPRAGRPGAANQPPPSFLQQRTQFLIDEGAAVTLEPSFRGDGGTLFVQSASVPTSTGARTPPWSKDAPKILPQLVCSIEHFNRLIRMIEAGEEPVARVELQVEFHEDDLMSYNTIAEIPGSDLKDEVVMLGGHMDSWHGGTGATDNAAGVAVCMEAARLIKAAGLQPRRTIRVALWSGEEQGLFGSRAYVKQHFGGFEEDPNASPGDSMAALFGGGGGRPLVVTPEYEKFCAYFNLDNGTGKIRGVYMEGNQGVRPIFRRWLAPFRELGAATLTPSPTGGTDHQAFDAIGLPGFQFIQDSIEYETRTHHSNQDVFDRIQAEDMKQAAAVMAAFVYNAAMMDEKLPRKPVTFPLKPADSQPAAPAASVGGSR